MLNAALIMEMLWFSRNKFLHEGEPVVASDLQNSLSRRFSEHSTAWLQQNSRLALCWVPPEPSFMKINFDVAICQIGSHIAVSCRDFSSSLCTVYVKQVKAMDPLLREAMATARAVEIGLEKHWPRVIFKTDSKLLWEDITNLQRSPCWKIEDLVTSLRTVFKAQSAWAIHWVLHKLNQQAHLLAHRAARCSISGVIDSICILFNILFCDSAFLPG
ncbi:hypothetical protein CJ030_MR6G013916 [Morella rubra]|uniref:RNase H type-1 domain-containing protein n=1 Tax=Morella rubra TaxID=262757 RepID=A0A6A1VHB2_9ROSI|nr:hypothetical protein CJ030_MR6G013916 [Morella rubra]